MKSKRGQLTLGDAPTIVLLVGLVFLVMATLALIASSAGDAFAGTQTATTVTNESISTPTDTGTAVATAGICGFQDFSVTNVNNDTHPVINPANYTITSTGAVINLTSEFIFSNWNVTYTYTGGGTACNVTADLNTELGNNTSIAGIILTISLVGIVLAVLIGVFLTVRRRRI